MNMLWRILFCAFSVVAGIAVVLAGVLSQAHVINLAYSSPELFLLVVVLFGVATYQGAILHDRVCENIRRKRDQGSAKR